MTRYTIIVEGRLDAHWCGAFGELVVEPRSDGTTALEGEVRDQSELHAQIRRIERLGLRLVSLHEGVSR